MKAALDELNGQIVTKYALTEHKYLLLLLGRASAYANEKTATALAALMKTRMTGAGSNAAGGSSGSQGADAQKRQKRWKLGPAGGRG